ncbi:MAG TPA: MFS transporter, partial [Candidatus Obscuribacter sp.]|nr:MFS transporter [Candidatus Obscuribacter sp.]
IGRVRTLIISILLYTLATGLCSLSHNWQELAFYRFLVGLGIGGELSVGTVVLSEHWQGKPRLHAVSFMATSWGFGYFATALMTAGLGGASWRYLFAAGVLPALITLYIRLKLRESKSFSNLKRQRRTKAQMNREPLREVLGGEYLRSLLVVIAITSSGIVGYWTVLSWIPSWINQMVGTDAVYERSLAMMLMNLGSVFGAGLTGFLVLCFGRQFTISLAFTMTLVLCQLIFNTSYSFDGGFLTLLFLCGFFSIMSATTICIYVPEIFPLPIQGTAFGLAFNFGRFFAAVIALVSAQLIASFNGSYASAASALSYIYVIGIVASCFMTKTSGEVLLDVTESGKAEVPEQEERLLTGV